MRKTNLLLIAGLFLLGIPVTAQPVFYPQDAKLVFVQDFEADWEQWTTIPVDTIFGIEYYNRQGSTSGTFNINNGSSDWEIYGVRDTVILMKNGVLTTDGDPRVFEEDNYSIEDDQSAERAQMFATYGQDGGQKVFLYESGEPVLYSEDTPWGISTSSSTGEYRNGVTANYRRNLFVRGLPIEEESSYRLTFYVKAQARPGYAEATPTLYADVMRGYFSSEKPFSMAGSSSSFAYQKTDFTGDWEKVTFMTYYTNDSIADAYMYSNGYWWAGGGQWTWIEEDGSEHNYIKQPDKFFARLSFASDNTLFEIDNLSLTKSWIGGCEYYGDKIRVDFGYQTNLGALAKAAYDKNKIDAVELPGEYFEVWGLRDGGNPNVSDDWVAVPIRSAEYHGDGYMYMFTQSFVVEGEEIPYTFDGYDKVLVSFLNPVDRPELCLYYTGNLYPLSTDQAWIEMGKPVVDFHNEEATLNPYSFDGVYSMKNLPPVMQEAAFEEGSFGLDPTIRELAFKFSRELDLDQFVATVGDETWDAEWDANSSSVVITRPEEFTADLDGDLVISLMNIKGTDTGFGADVVLNYNFGEIDRHPQVSIMSSDWRSEVDIVDLENGARPVPTSLYVHNGIDEFQKGTGSGVGAKCGLYALADDDCLFYLSARTSGNTGNLYTVMELIPGTYNISFKAFGWGTTSMTNSLYFYAKPDADLADGNNNGFAVLEAVDGKTFIGSFSPKVQSTTNYGVNYSWLKGTETYDFTFTVPVEGEYVFEWVAGPASNYNGFAMSNYTITTGVNLAYSSVNALNSAIESARHIAALAEADLENYGGAAYSQLLSTINYYDEEFTSTAPSAWTEAENIVNADAQSLESRMDDVDEYKGFLARVMEVLTEFVANNDLVEYYSLRSSYNAFSSQDLTQLTYQDMQSQEETMDEEISLLESRVDLNKEFNVELQRGWDLYNEAKYPDYEEYESLYNILEIYSKYNVSSGYASDVELAIETVKDAINAYIFSWIGLDSETARLKALYNLTKYFGTGIEGVDLHELVYSAVEDDDALADVMKAAIKVALYQQLAKGYNFEGLDLTPFIKNYNLYATPKVVDRLNYRMPTDANKLNFADTLGAQIQNVRHAYNYASDGSYAPIWIMILGQQYDDLLPGWTIEAANASSGNRMVTVDDEDYLYFSNDIPVFDGMVTLDWNSRAYLSTVLTGLPAGYYSIGLQLPEMSKSVTLVAETLNDTVTATAKTSDSQELYTDYLFVDSESDVLVNIDLNSGSGFTKADNFSLIYTPAGNVDYAALVADAQAELDAALEAYGFVYDPLAEAKAALDNAIADANSTLEYAGDNIYSGEDYDRLASAVEAASKFVGEDEDDYYDQIRLLGRYSEQLYDRVYVVDNYLSYLYASEDAIEEYADYSYLDEFDALVAVVDSLSSVEFQLLSNDMLESDIDLLEDVIEDLLRAVLIVEEGLFEMSFDDGLTCSAGTELVIPIKMFNTSPITAFQLDVMLPYGMTFVKAELAADRTGSDHTLTYNENSGYYDDWGYYYNGPVVSLACLSMTNDTLIGNDGAVVYLTVKADQNMKGEYEIDLFNIEMTETPTVSHTQDYYWGIVTVTGYIEPGDVNKDGRITITDAVGVIAFIINSDVKGLSESAADANQDGVIDAADVVYIVNKVIRKSFASRRDGSAATIQDEERYITSSMTMNEVDVEAGSRFDLPVVLEGMPYEITAVQFSLTLPENIRLEGITTDRSHMVSFREQADGTYKVISLSLSNSTFEGNGEAALTLQLTADSKFNNGEVVLSDGVLVTPDCDKVTQEPVAVLLGEGDQTGIRGIAIDSNADMYDLQGRAIDNANGIYIQNGKKVIQLK